MYSVTECGDTPLLTSCFGFSPTASALPTSPSRQWKELAPPSSHSTGPSISDQGSVLKQMVSVNTNNVPHLYLVADSHVGFTSVVPVPQINSLPPIHECQAMEAFHCVGGHSSMSGDIVLWFVCHVLEELQKAICLCLAGKTILYTVGLVTGPLKRNLYICIMQVLSYP